VANTAATDKGTAAPAVIHTSGALVMQLGDRPLLQRQREMMLLGSL